jgi:tRNA-dihydrouridine synthase B
MPHALLLNGKPLSPPLSCAPMAGITHSAFRRLLADFGGYGALCTEMLSARALAAENVLRSPFTRRRAAEGVVIYQLGITQPEQAARAIDALGPVTPDALDINLGCPAPEVVRLGGGCQLFCDVPRLSAVLRAVRAAWPGALLAKFRLGANRPGWETTLSERIRLFEDCGVDGLTLHPRFEDEKLKRVARWDVLPRIAAATRLPLTGNGDIDSAADLADKRERFPMLAGFMIGRMAVVQPWIFAQAAGLHPAIDYTEVWERFHGYVMEDFAPEKALGRVKEFTAYYSRNFAYDHQLFRVAQGAKTLPELRERALAYCLRTA